MKRTTVNLVIDMLAAALFLGMIATGYVLHFPLPPGTNKSLSLWSLTRHQWGNIHFWISLALLGVLLTHLILHWQWVVTVVGRKLSLTTDSQSGHFKSGVIALLTVVVAMGLFAWMAEVSVRERAEDCCPPGDVSATSQASSAVTDASELRAGDDKGNFWTEVYPVLAASCLSCHGPKKARGGFRIDRRNDYFVRNGEPPLVVPGRSAESGLIAIVTGSRKDIAMPDRHRLPDKDVATVKKWIDAGATWTERPTGKSNQ